MPIGSRNTLEIAEPETRGAQEAEVFGAAAARAYAPPEIMVDEKRSLRRKTVVVAIIAIALGLVSACVTSTTPPFVSPIELLEIYGMAIQHMWLSAFDPAQAMSGAEMMAAHPTYYWTLTNTVITFAYFMCGCMLALSGALYQNVFRNPIASPSMLGVSSGVQLGVAVLIMIFGTMAGGMLAERYLFCFVAVTVVLAVLFGLAQLMSGKGRPLNVTNMLVVGVIVNQLIGVIVSYLTWFHFTEEEYDIFMGLTTMVEVSGDPLTWSVLITSFLLAVVPIVLMRFRMNALNFSPAEMRMFGVNARRLQLMALVFGTIIMVTAQIQVGAVAMITLVVPHIARAVFGSEFRKQLLGTMLLGASVLVACHIIAVAFPYSGEIPVGMVVNLVLLPAFVWLIAAQQRRWE